METDAVNRLIRIYASEIHTRFELVFEAFPPCAPLKLHVFDTTAFVDENLRHYCHFNMSMPVGSRLPLPAALLSAVMWRLEVFERRCTVLLFYQAFQHTPSGFSVI